MDYISRERFDLLGSGKVKTGDLLFCLRGSLGKVAIVGDIREGAIASSLVILRPGPLVDGRYLVMYLGSDLCGSMIARFRNGTAQPNLSAASLKQFVVPLPSLSEQRRIVAILDGAFEDIKSAKANAEKNLQNARELFESYRDSMFSGRGEGIVHQRLGEFARFRNGINYTKQSKGQTVRIVGVKDFQNNFWVPLEEGLDRVTVDGELSPTDMVREGDMLTVRSNGNPELIGRCMIAGNVPHPMTHSGFTIRITVDQDKALPTYVCQFMRTRRVRRKLIEGGNGVNIKSLNQGMLSDVVVPLPSVAQQQKISARIEDMSVATARLTKVTLRKIAGLEELRKCLLHRAFNGALNAKSTDRELAAIA
jgi:type I restriction enzyme, S subunit